jgi:hypothetical protein
MDPSKVNQQEIRDQRKTTIETIFRTLDEFITRIVYYCHTTLSKYDCHLTILVNSI